VTVSAMILSFGRFGITPAEQVKGLDKRWTAYQKESKLALYGKTTVPTGTSSPTCAHSNAPG
jgi:hypothetical protein